LYAEIGFAIYGYQPGITIHGNQYYSAVPKLWYSEIEIAV